MSTPVIQEARLSFIWVETALERLADPAPAAPLACLSRDSGYIARFENLQRGGSDPDGLTLPWPKPSGQRFWTYYLGRRPGDVNGGRAWDALVPLRLKLEASLSAPWFPGRSGVAEGFFYPHGHALLVTFAVGPVSLPLPSFVDLACDVRKRRKLVVSSSWSPPRELILDAFADSALAEMRARTVGKAAPPGVVASAPFSVVTLVKMEEVDPALPLPDGDEVHRALEAVTSWDPKPVAHLAPLEDSVIDLRTTPNVVYTKKRGRAIWFPYSATAQGVRTLSCYGRNLTYASLQVESLARLVEESAQASFLSVTHRDVARYAGGLLGRIYGGNVKTYKTASCRLQLEQNAWLDATDSIRVRFPPMDKLRR